MSNHALLVAIALRLILVGRDVCCAQEDTLQQPQYGVDVSWPMHHAKVSTNYPWLPHNIDPTVETPSEYKDMVLQPLGDVQSKHDAYMQACFDYYQQKNGKGERCYDYENDRVALMLEQPGNMINFTHNGYSMTRIPDYLLEELVAFFQANLGKQTSEKWGSGDIHTNHWEAPSTYLDIADPTLEGGGFALQQLVIHEVRKIVEDWTQQRQVSTSVYGIRIYPTGAMLAPHVDRNPLISSAIINVASDLDEPWPLEVIGHDGLAHNISQTPGDLVLYESHSVIHGRQFPLKGKYMANIFVHFEPVGPRSEPLDYERDFPPYMDPDSEQAQEFFEEFPEGGYLEDVLDKTNEDTRVHEAAALGDIENLIELLDEEPSKVEDRDENGWTALAEAVRTGNAEVVRLLLDRGSDHHALLGEYETEGSIMYVARGLLEEGDPVLQLLQKRGAREVEPLFLGSDEL